MCEDGAGVVDRDDSVNDRREISVELGREASEAFSWDIEAEVILVFRRRRAECFTLSFHLADAFAQSLYLILTSPPIASSSESLFFGSFFSGSFSARALRLRRQ